MIRTTFISAAALLLASCAHDATTATSAKRGEPVGVNSAAPVTGSVTGSIQPAPSAMATTSSSGTSR